MVASFQLGRVPRITFGAGGFARVPEVVASHGRRVLLVTGGRSLAASGRRDVLLAGLEAAGVALAGEVTVTDEPSPTVVDAAVAAHRDDAVDVVLGIGGGSVIDAAKAIAGLLRTGASVVEHLEGLPGMRPYDGPSVPFVAVPTTAGTGSEATRNAVISERGPAGYKRSFRDERLVAADAIVDPDLLAGNDPVGIAANGMDALTQLLEAYTSLRAGPLTDALALSGLEAARDGLVAWHADPDGPGAGEARSRMAYAALLSGICLAHAGLGAVHGLASPLGAQFPVPHGAACGATLAAVTATNIGALVGARAVVTGAGPVCDARAAGGRPAGNERRSRGARCAGRDAQRVDGGAPCPAAAGVRDRGSRYPGDRRRCARKLDAHEPGRPDGRRDLGDPGRDDLRLSADGAGRPGRPGAAGAHNAGREPGDQILGRDDGSGQDASPPVAGPSPARPAPSVPSAAAPPRLRRAASAPAATTRSTRAPAAITRQTTCSIPNGPRTAGSRHVKATAARATAQSAMPRRNAARSAGRRHPSPGARP